MQPISHLIGLIPEEAAYRRHTATARSLELEIELVAQAHNDPALGAKFIGAFVEVHQPLPACIYEPGFLRAYGHRRFGAPDPDVEAAFALEHDSSPARRILVRCMLLREEYNYHDIGQRVGLSAESLRIYQTLFWPVRDRAPAFVLSLVYPRSAQCELEPGYAQNETKENLAYRMALRIGIEAVERYLGIKKDLMKNNSNIDEMADALARQFLGNARSLVEMGFINQDLPGLKNGLAVLRILNAGRRRQEITPVRYANGVSAAVAVSQALSRLTDVPHSWRGSAGATSADASDKGSAGTMENMPEISGEQVPMKSNKTVTPLAPQPEVEIVRLDAAA